MITENLTKRAANIAANAFVPIVFGIAAKAALGAAAYAAKHIEFPEDGFVEVQLKKIRKLLTGTPNSLKKEKEILQKRIAQAKQNFNCYKSKHEELLLKDIQHPIDEINKNKAVIKEAVLKKLADALIKVEIKSDIKDYPLEVLDYREFPISDNFNIVEKHHKKLEKLGYELNDAYLVVTPMLYIFKSIKDLKKLHDESEKFKDEANNVLAEMKNELNRMNELQMALDNISGIFSDLKSKYVPFIEDFTEEVAKEYSSYEEIPEKYLHFIKNCTIILREICEKKIVNCGSLEKVKEYSDEVSIKYCDLKAQFGIAA